MDPILPESIRRSQMYSYVNANIPPQPRFHTLAEWTAYRAKLKQRLMERIGIDDLVRKPLQVQKRGVLQRGSFRIEKILYETFPGMWVPALVWTPSNVSGKAPAMVSISGHTYCESKAADYVQARNYNLVKRGFIVISYDYLGCSERSAFDPCAGGFGGFDHTNALFSYTRRSQTGIEVLDGIRAIDYLISRADVDPKRIGFTGESGGGNSTYWVSALDDRLSLSVPVSSAGSFDQWIKFDLNYDWHQRPPGIRSIADIGLLYALAAPRPLLIVNGTPELSEFALPDALRSVDYARHVYRLYGASERISFHQSTTGHGYQPDKRLLLYGWLSRWFGVRAGDDEPYTPEPREQLLVGMPPGNETIRSLARRWIDETPTVPMPADTETFQARGRTTLGALLELQESLAAPNSWPTYPHRRIDPAYRVERLLLETGRDTYLPAVFVTTPDQQRRDTTILLGKRNGATPEVEALLKAGHAVMVFDPLGTGEVDWGGDRTTNWANLMGRPPIGLWVDDIRRTVTYLLARPDVGRVVISGSGVLGKAGLYAAAVDTRISGAVISTDTLSYRQEAQSGLTHVYADVPRILTWGDTAQLAALVSPRPLAVCGAGRPISYNDERPTYFAPTPRLNLIGAPVTLSDLESNYTWTAEFYKRMNAASRFKVSTSCGQELAEWLPSQLSH